MSEFTWSAGMLGRVIDDHGHDIQVGCTPGHVHLVIGYPGGELLVRLSGERQAMFRELLDRTAMPGLTEKLPRAAKCPRCGLPDGAKPVPGTAAAKCEHIWHQYRPQAELEARHPLTVAAVSPELAEAMGEIADAAQEAPPCPAP